MTTDAPPGAPAASRFRTHWVSILLVLSLALNLLFLGGGVTRYMMHEPPGRMTGISEMQLIPRKFFGDISQQRRSELLAVFKDFRGEFRDGRAARQQLAVDLAMALEAEPYDAERVKQAVEAFTSRSSGLIARGGDAAVAFIGKLDDSERRLLARRIRERSGHHEDERKDEHKDD